MYVVEIAMTDFIKIWLDQFPTTVQNTTFHTHENQ